MTHSITIDDTTEHNNAKCTCGWKAASSDKQLLRDITLIHANENSGRTEITREAQW
jgi:predicted small metal-binding protein